MGRYSVRTAIAAAITNAGLPYVGTVFPARPVIVEETAYTETMFGQAVQASPSGSSAILIVNMPDDDRVRFGLVGRAAAADWWKHRIAMEVFFACPAGDGITAQFDYDLVIDSLTESVRENPTMSAPATVWSAGEYTYGVRHAQEQPYTSEDGLQVLIAGVVKFEAWEQIMGPFPVSPD